MSVLTGKFTPEAIENPPTPGVTTDVQSTWSLRSPRATRERIQFGREYCSIRKPARLEGPEARPLFDRCERVGANLETGAVVDPAEATDE